MLNIGMLASGGGEYYVGEVATSAEDYYTGRGEAAGRWVGSLAKQLELSGEVDPAEFRRLLDGRDPHSGEVLVSAAGSASLAAARRGPQDPSEAGDVLDVVQAAAAINRSTRYVRMLLDEGSRYAERVATDPTAEPPKSYLAGSTSVTEKGTVRWSVPRGEVDRYLSSHRDKQHRAAYDVTLRPPKSVSVLWALGDERIRAEVRSAHTAAVDSTVSYLESHAIRAREKGIKVTDGVVAAAFDHRTSRAGDPLLHTHVVTANMTKVTDGSWRTLYSPGLFEHAKAGGCVYQAHLRHELQTRLGVEFTPVTNGTAEVDGIPEDVMRLFSKRRQEIEEVLAESGTGSARSAQIATLETRKAKQYGVDPETLVERWRSEAATIGFTPEHLDGVVGRVDGPTAIDDAAWERLFAIMAGPHGLTAMAATFTRSDVTAAIASAAGASLTAVGVDRMAGRFLGDTRRAVVAERVRGSRPGVQQRFTTPEIRDAEVRLLHLASANAGEAYVDPETVADVLATRTELSAEQVVMITGLCETARVLQAVEGRPGAGKTYATEAVVAAHVADGVPILGCAVSAAAAAELESQAGFERSMMPATTIARMLIDLDRHGLADRSVIVVDEASMASTRDLHRLARHAESAGGRMVLIGDPDQHGAVEAGGIFARLCADETHPTIRLVENRRQADHGDRLAVEEYREGRIADALARLDEGGKVVRCSSAGEAFDAMAADWYAARLSGGVDPMIAGPNSTRRALNERARILLATAGDLTGDPLVVKGRDFQVGEQIVCRRNARHLTGQQGDFVKNGSVGTVESIDHAQRSMTVAFDNEGTIELPAKYLESGHVDYGYARTTYGVQGQTHRQARYLPTDLSGFEEGYVALTRGADGTKVFIIDGTEAVEGGEDAHGPVERTQRSIETLTPSLQRRRAQTIATQHARPSRHQRSLSTVSLELRKLERAMASCPPDVSVMIEQARSGIEALSVKERAWRDASTNADQPARERAASELTSLSSRSTRMQRRLDALVVQQERHETWTTEHADVIERYDDVRAEERELVAAIRSDPDRHLPGVARARLGHATDYQPDRHRIDAAKIRVAVYLARWEPALGAGEDEVAEILGGLPDDPVARIERQEVIEALGQLPVGVDQTVGVDL